MDADHEAAEFILVFLKYEVDDAFEGDDESLNQPTPLNRILRLQRKGKESWDSVQRFSQDFDGVIQVFSDLPIIQILKYRHIARNW